MVKSTGKSHKPDDKKVQQAYAKAVKTYGHRDNVNAVDVGFMYDGEKRTDKIAVRIHVREKIPLAALEAAEIFPTEIDGVPLDIIQGNYTPTAHAGNAVHASNAALAEDALGNTGASIEALSDRRQRHDPIHPGISVGHTSVTAGTIGAVVFDRVNGQLCILSNWHVLAGSNFAQPGDAIVQPGRTDGGNAFSDAIGQLRRMHLGRAGDAAIAVLNGARQIQRNLHDSDISIRTTRRAQIGDRVRKSGRTTGLTDGIVDGIGLYQMVYNGETKQIEGFRIRPEDGDNPANLEISAGGDSGALWYDPDSHEGLGLHFAGESEPAPTAEFALACHLQAVLDVLNVTFDPMDVGSDATPDPIPIDDPIPPSGPTLADLLAGLGVNEETLHNLNHGDACAAVLREQGLSVTTGADGRVEILIDPQKTRCRLRLSLEPA